MRENRTYGSEGGEGLHPFPTPIGFITCGSAPPVKTSKTSAELKNGERVRAGQSLCCSGSGVLKFYRSIIKIAAPIAVPEPRRGMARPREFDETMVLEAAMNCFWAQGFEQTSVRDLAERMGITGASLYNAFGDKRSLYRQAFVHYLTQTVRDRVARLEKLPSALAIRTFFDEIIERSVDDEQRRGCMLVNAALELAPDDPEFQRRTRVSTTASRRSLAAP